MPIAMIMSLLLGVLTLIGVISIDINSLLFKSMGVGLVGGLILVTSLHYSNDSDFTWSEHRKESIVIVAATTITATVAVIYFFRVI